MCHLAGAQCIVDTTTLTAFRSTGRAHRISAAPLEHLHGSLVSNGGRAGSKRSQIPPPTGSWIPLPRIQTVMAV
jgi:hypothetical protein